MPNVRAVLEFPATGTERRLATLRVRVEDTSRADAAADVVGETELADVVIPADGAAIPVEVEYDDVAGTPALTVRAHGSADGARAFTSGDFVSTSAVRPEPDVHIPLKAI